VGLSVPTLFGAFISVVAFDESSFVNGLALNGPGWLVLPILATGIIGSLGQGGLNLYSMGLDLDAILPRLTRTQATFAVTAIALGLVFLGKFVWDAESSVTTYVLFLTSLATPWAVITMIGYARTRGRFDQDSLQVFNRRATGGAYWFFHGWNIDATVAWAIGSVVGILSNSTENYVGPIAERLGGLDASVLTSAVAAGMVYLLLVALRPHAHAARDHA
jgi:purine-cytosine permease-like protein